MELRHQSDDLAGDTEPDARSRRGRPAQPNPSRTVLAARLALCDRLSEASAAAWQAVAPHALRRPTRSDARIAFARQNAMYFAHVIFGATLTRAGRIFGRDRTTARHACSLIEDRRDDRRFDRAIDLLEPAIRAWYATFSGGAGR